MSRGTYYRIGSSIWLEPWDDDTRHVAFYILTCSHRSTEGLFRMPLAYAVADMNWPAKRFERAFGQLLAHDFVAYDSAAYVCLIVKALTWQAPENPNQVTAALKVIEQLPPTPLLNRFYELAATHCERLAQGLREAFPRLMAERHPELIAESPSPSPSPSLNGSGGATSEGEFVDAPPLPSLKGIPR